MRFANYFIQKELRMTQAPEFSWLPLVAENYGVKVQGTPVLLNERDEQRVYQVTIVSGESLTLRLCPPGRSYARVQADTEALRFLNRANFPAPVLLQTRTGQAAFAWQPDSWAYAHNFIEGENPEMDLPTLQELAALLARLHLLASRPQDYPAQVNWLAELPGAIEKAEICRTDSKWRTIATEVAATLRGLPDLSKLPVGLIHTDVHEGNLLRGSDGRLYLLDWEDAGLGEMVFDVALVLGWNCVWPVSKNLNGEVNRYDFDKEWCCTFLKAYQEVRPLAPLEAQSLGPAIRFVMGWFAARDIAREVTEPGVSEGLAFTNWAIMHSVTSKWEKTLTQWAIETSPQSGKG